MARGPARSLNFRTILVDAALVELALDKADMQDILARAYGQY